MQKFTHSAFSGLFFVMPTADLNTKSDILVKLNRPSLPLSLLRSYFLLNVLLRGGLSLTAGLVFYITPTQ